MSALQPVVLGNLAFYRHPNGSQSYYHEPRNLQESPYVILTLRGDPQDPFVEHFDTLEPGMVDPSLTLQAPGLLHMLHNTSRDLKKMLPRFSMWLPKLKEICRLLHPPYQSRLIATCIAIPEEQRKLQQCSAHPFEHRWGTIAHAVARLLEIEPLLRQRWDIQKFCFSEPQSSSAPEQDGEEAEGRLQIQQLDEALRDPGFWTYSHMVNLLADMLHRIELIGESCVCHMPSSVVVSLAGDSEQWDTEDLKLFRAEGCPLRGRRAPELAVGDVHLAIRSLATSAHARLLTLGGHLRPQELAEIMEDLAKGRGYIISSLEIKLSCWLQLPLVLASVGHHNLDKARKGIKRAAEIYDSLADPEQHHALSNLCLKRGSPMRLQLDLFVAGKPLASLPLAMELAGRMRFMPVVERLVEGLHARIKRFTGHARHHTASYVSFSLLRRTLEANCLHDADYVLLPQPFEMQRNPLLEL